MRGSKYLVVDLLGSFDRKEQNSFQLFVSSPFYNRDKKILTLLNILLKYVNNDEVDDFNLTNIYKQLFEVNVKCLSTKQFSQLYSKMSLLLSLAQQFLMIQTLQNKETVRVSLLQESLLSKKQYRLYEQFITKQKKVSKDVVAKGIDFYEQKYIIEGSVLQYAQLTGSISKSNNIVKVKDNLTLYFILSQLDLHLVELSLSELSSTHQIDVSTLEAFQPLLCLPQFVKHPLIKVYLSVIKLLNKKTEGAFFQLQKKLEDYHDEIPHDSLINFYSSMLNFCVLQVRKGKIDYLKYQLNLYKTMDSKHLLLIDKKMHIGNFRNIIGLACQLDDFNWATQILYKYIKFIPIKLKNEIQDFNLGVISFYQKYYQKAIDYLFPLPNINLTHDINRRIFIMKAYYEVDKEYLETTQTLFRSFEKYIREHKNITHKNKTSYKNFIRTLINLYRIKHLETKMKLENVKGKLLAQKLNSNKSWLLEKIEELKRRI